MTSRIYAEWAAALTFDQLPPEVVTRAQEVVADFLGESFYVASRLPWGDAITAFCAESGGGQPEATIVGGRGRTLASRAALANCTLALGYEYADVLWKGSSRPSPFSVGPALAVAEQQHRPGRDLLLGVVVAYELMYRVATGMSSEQIAAAVERRVYPAAMMGMFGAGMAASRTLGLTAEQTLAALAVASAVPGGTFHGHYSGSWTRPLQAGLAGERGVTAALLAQRGFQASRDPVEDFYKTFASSGYDQQALVSGLGESWAIMQTWTKAYPLNGTLHAAVEAVIGAMTEHSLTAADIESMTVSWHMYADFLGERDPQTPIAAQASLPFAVAAAAAYGHITVDAFTEEAISNPLVRELIGRVVVETDTALYEQVDGECVPARVVIRTRDGRTAARETLFPKGHPRNPLSSGELRAKFLSLATASVSHDQGEQLYAALMRLYRCEDVTAIGPLLGPQY